LVQHLRNALGLVPGHRAQFTAADAVRFAAKLKMWKGEIRGEGHKTFVLTPPLEPRLRLDASTFNLWFETASPGPSGRSPSHRMSAATVLRAWQDGASLVPLTEGGWAPLPLSWLQRFGHRVADLLAGRAANGSLPRYTLPELASRRAAPLVSRTPPVSSKYPRQNVSWSTTRTHGDCGRDADYIRHPAPGCGQASPDHVGHGSAR